MKAFFDKRKNSTRNKKKMKVQVGTVGEELTRGFKMFEVDGRL